jgi:hypothetical protein
VPIVSKKSDSITARIAAVAVASPSTSNTPKLKLPNNEKSGVLTILSGITAIPCSNTAESPNPWFTMIANTVVARMPISSPPFTVRTTSVDVMARPTTNTRTWRFERFGFSVIRVASLFTTIPPLTNPMIARNNPIPIPIARLRSMGMAFRTASRNPVSTRSVMIAPSITMTPIACGHVRPNVATSENVTNAFSPSPAAIANG